MNKLEQFEKSQLEAVMADRKIPDFGPGDTLKVNVKVVEGNRERVQAFEGVCIARSNDGINSSFTVRKISYGEGVERIFPLYSPRLDSIELVRRGDVRRSKLYYLRGLRGKAARIAEKKEYAKQQEESVGEAVAKAAKEEKEAKAKEAAKATSSAADAEPKKANG